MLSVVIYYTHKPFEGPPAEAMGPVSPLSIPYLFIHLSGPTQEDTHDSLDVGTLKVFYEVKQHQLFSTVAIVQTNDSNLHQNVT